MAGAGPNQILRSPPPLRAQKREETALRLARVSSLSSARRPGRAELWSRNNFFASKLVPLVTIGVTSMPAEHKGGSHCHSCSEHRGRSGHVTGTLRAHGSPAKRVHPRQISLVHIWKKNARLASGKADFVSTHSYVGKVEAGKLRPPQEALISAPSSVLSPACVVAPGMAPGHH